MIKLGKRSQIELKVFDFSHEVVFFHTLSSRVFHTLIIYTSADVRGHMTTSLQVNISILSGPDLLDHFMETLENSCRFVKILKS